MEWVVKTLKPDLEPESCGEGQMHLPDAPFKITNQRLPDGASWAAWWATNKHKSQIEWIRDGFRQQGVELQQPLSNNNTVDLLKLIATTKQGHLEYNGKRWLRDSGFEPREFDLASLANDEKEVVPKGVLTFQHWLNEHRHDPGRLSIETDSRDDDQLEPESPTKSSLPSNRPLDLCIVGLAATGVMLLLRGLVRPPSSPISP